jgi:predicted outer membrane repeat protein
MVIAAGSRPVFTNCQIRDNVSGTGTGGTGNIGSGGGVHVNDASPTFRGCLITGNRSKFAGGGIFHMGVYESPYGTSMLLVEDSEVSNNITERFSPAENPAEGGGIHVEDNAIGYLLRAKIRGNTANTGGGLNSYRARYEIFHTIIDGNHAQDPLGVGGFGGGISITSNNLSTPLRGSGSLAMVDSVVRANDSRVGGGLLVSGDQLCGSPVPSCNPATAPRALVQISDSVISENSAGVYGGGLRMDRADVTITGSHILRNTAAASGQSFGGGLLLASGAAVSIQSSTIARNSSANFGGGIFADEAVVLNVTGSRVYANSANSGGGLYIGNNGTASGVVQTTTIADNFNYQVHEQACSPLVRTILVYSNNNIVPRSGQSDLYYSTCGGASSSINAFNSLPSGRASGNVSTTPSFVSFLATPDVAPSLLSWSVSRASSASISGIGTFPGDTGNAYAWPASPTNYTLTNSGGPATAVSAYVYTGWSFGAQTDTPAPGDFDGDGRDDTAVYRLTTGQWFVFRSTAGFMQVSWGAPGFEDVPVAADYDGDGVTDIAVFRRATNEWFIRRSTGGMTTAQWGSAASGDVPLPRDYDGDGRADIAVYRATTGQWLISRSTGGSVTINWGAPWLGDVPAPADYDGDRRADVAVYRASTGQWFISRSSGGSMSVTWGSPAYGDQPVPAGERGLVRQPLERRDAQSEVGLRRRQSAR